MPTTAQDVVGVFDQSGNQLFEDARAVRAMVMPRAKIMSHPAETGVNVSDHIIYEPLEIELSCILDPADFQDTYQQIKSVFLSAQGVTVQTKTDTYANMFIIAPPYDEVCEMFDTVAVGIKLEQVTFVEAQYAQLPASLVKKPSDASTTKAGQKTPAAATPSQTSTAFSLIFGSGQ